MSAPKHSSVPALPQELWGLVSQELTTRRDFLSLFNLARVNRSMATEALPLLYSIHELSPASSGDMAVLDVRKWAVLWRSILASSLRGTLYPYCLWIKSLSLGNLFSLLEDLARDAYKDIRALFFSAPLERFHIREPTGNNVATRSRRAWLAIEPIIFEATDHLTEFIKSAAKEADKTVGLTSLEGLHMPAARLLGWVSRLSLLTRLAVRDGSVLNSDVAVAIRENCPLFRELMCHYCYGDDVDEDLSGFLRGLVPNSLASFTIMSQNRAGTSTFMALGEHSSSLQELALYAEDFAAAELPLLGNCTNLVDVTLDVNPILSPDWANNHRQEVRSIASWLKGCASLKTLSVTNLPGTLPILAEVLQVPSIKLTDLEISVIFSVHSREETIAFSKALATQTDLTSFGFRSRDGAFGGSSDFVQALCHCTKLRKLDLTTQMLNVDDFNKLANAMQDVEWLGFDIDSEEPIGDEYTFVLAAMHQLKVLNVNATTAFTYQGLLRWFDTFSNHPPRSHQGISIHIMRQVGTQKFSPTQLRKLNDKLAKQFGGKIDVTLDADPDELNESDFSD
ncbi:hypothetical protein GE09DRAFT_697781 [Coniochaeta sp. 2T2.1]|nr:hypothetical protein GE09DRAFT_697781 [Coniochaeta sp. 2T2.1]